jgi:uncharacterized membrane protein YkvA (DUF1232 family)
MSPNQGDNETKGKYAEDFQKWIDFFDRDVNLFVEILNHEETPKPLKRIVATGLNYLLKQMDFVPDHYKPIGIIDDCIVLRVLADIGADYNAELSPKFMKAMFKLANDCDLLREFLGNAYRPLENEVRLMMEREVRRRSPNAIVADERVREDLLRDVKQEMAEYKAVAIEAPERAERELLSYFKTKLGV